MWNNNFIIRFILIFVMMNFLMTDTSFSETIRVQIKKAELLSKIIKLGDVLEIEFELEKSADGSYPVRLYMKDADGKPATSIMQILNFVEDKTIYNVQFEIPKNIPVSSFYQDDAQPHKVYMKIGENEEKEIGNISLYRNWQIIRDGIIELPGFRIPFYVILMSFLGALGYGFTSITKRPEFTMRNIWKLIYRLFIGPLLGIFLYSISTLLNSSPDPYIIGALCFASGFYISPIQAKMRNLVYDKLAPDKKLEDDIAELEADETELMTRLLMSRRASYYLKKESIVTVSDLSAVSDDKLKSLSTSFGIDENYLLKQKEKARSLDNENLSKLNMPLSLLKKMPKNIKFTRDILGLDASKMGLGKEEEQLLSQLTDIVTKTVKIDRIE